MPCCCQNYVADVVGATAIGVDKYSTANGDCLVGGTLPRAVVLVLSCAAVVLSAVVCVPSSHAQRYMQQMSLSGY
jgi:hypothetical protein